jgi:glycerol uptake facilitator protein
MSVFIAEFIGTFVLLFFGATVVANVSLKKTLASGGGDAWILITAAWGFAVFCGVIVAGQFSGAHLNPAVSVGLAMAGKFSWSLVPIYVCAQLLGAMAGSFLAYILYIDHFRATEDEGAVRGCFCTGPAIRNYKNNFFSEFFGTFLLVFIIFYIASPNIEVEGVYVVQYGIGSLEALPVGILVWLLGMTVGGTTGYAINPTRDLGPRIVYSLLPRKNKNPDWAYSWIPVVAPICGAIAAGLVFNLLN